MPMEDNEGEAGVSRSITPERRVGKEGELGRRSLRLQCRSEKVLANSMLRVNS